MRLLLFFMAFVKTATSLKCAVCRAVDKKSCQDTQIIQQCPYATKCMTVNYLVYKGDEGTSETSQLLVKGCLPRNTKCEENCKTAKKLHRIKHCWNSCCTSDRCNQHVYGDIIVKPKSKRSRGMENSARNMNANRIMLLGLLAIVFYIRQAL